MNNKDKIFQDDVENMTDKEIKTLNVMDKLDDSDKFIVGMIELLYDRMTDSDKKIIDQLFTDLEKCNTKEEINNMIQIARNKIE